MQNSDGRFSRKHKFSRKNTFIEHVQMREND